MFFYAKETEAKETEVIERIIIHANKSDQVI